MNSNWTCALELGPDRSVASGNEAALCAAIRRGADLRVYTEWNFEEHVAPGLADPNPNDNGLLQEIIDMRQTILVDDRFAAGVTTLRQAIIPCVGFNPDAPNRMSFFLYGMDGGQACANIALDDAMPQGEPGLIRSTPAPTNMPKMSETEENDIGTTGPSRNFVYQMEKYRYFVRDDWSPILEHDENGDITGGSWEAFHQAHLAGCEFKVGIANLNADLSNSSEATSHEVFSLLGSGWIHTAHKRYEVLSHPIVRVTPAIPLKYRSRNWDVSWIYLRTNGRVAVRSLNPYTRKFHEWETQRACRWFVR